MRRISRIFFINSLGWLAALCCCWNWISWQVSQPVIIAVSTLYVDWFYLFLLPVFCPFYTAASIEKSLTDLGSGNDCAVHKTEMAIIQSWVCVWVCVCVKPLTWGHWLHTQHKNNMWLHLRRQSEGYGQTLWLRNTQKGPWAISKRLQITPHSRKLFSLLESVQIAQRLQKWHV